MKRKKSLKSLHKKSWKLMSELVRRNENCCYTCGATGPWRDHHAGHFVHRNCLDYDPRNVHRQCAGCNTFRHGNLAIYAEKLIKDYGAGIIEELNQLGNQISKPSREELEKLIVVLTEAIDGLQ